MLHIKVTSQNTTEAEQRLQKTCLTCLWQTGCNKRYVITNGNCQNNFRNSRPKNTLTSPEARLSADPVELCLYGKRHQQHHQQLDGSTIRQTHCLFVLENQVDTSAVLRCQSSVYDQQYTSSLFVPLAFLYGLTFKFGQIPVIRRCGSIVAKN